MAPSLLFAAFVTTTLIFIFDSSPRYYQLYYVPVVAFAYPVLASELARLKDHAASACRKLLILLTLRVLPVSGRIYPLLSHGGSMGHG